jgi:peptidoglycan/xylan/chitin deacetylase (PgdA/CDA1 family)
MEIGAPDSQMTNDILVEQSRFSYIGCTGMLIVVLTILIALGARFGRSEASSVEMISIRPEIQTVELNGEAQLSAQSAATLPAVTPTGPRQATATPTATLQPTATPESIATSSVRLPRSAEQEIPLSTPTTLSSTETPRLLITETPNQDFTIRLNPTPTDNLSSTLRVPILMYHYVSRPPANADIYRNDLSVTPENFREQMVYLVEEGYSTIDLYDLSTAVTNKGSLPDKPIILTFDDGYIDNYQNAFQILQEFELKATFFVATGFVDAGNPNYMDWTMIEEMSAAGMRFEPHSKTHLDLREKEREVLLYEILGSQETIAAHTGYVPRYFAYPGGRYDGPVIDILSELGFWGAVTTAVGSWHGYDDRYEWTRQRVRLSTNLNLFSDLVD